MPRKLNQIIGELKSRYWLRTRKSGMKIPKSVEEENSFDEDDGKTLWWDAIYQ